LLHGFILTDTVSSDLTSDMSSSEYQSLLEVWLRMLNILKCLTQQLKIRVYGRRCLVVAAKVRSIITRRAALSHLYYFKLSLFVLGIPNELPELEVANSRRRRYRPPTGYAHASLRLAATGELGR